MSLLCHMIKHVVISKFNIPNILEYMTFPGKTVYNVWSKYFVFALYNANKTVLHLTISVY